MDEPASVVIVGASFSGLAALRVLERYGNSKMLRVTVVEPRDYFEYTPGVLRAFVEPQQSHRITRPLREALGDKITWVRGWLKSINHDSVVVRSVGGHDEVVTFHHLILATGSNYASPIKASPAELELTHRIKRIKSEHQMLSEAKRIVIVGGGTVGVELAAEIVAKFKKKPVALVSRSTSLLPTFPAAVGEAALRWLAYRGVKILLGDEVEGGLKSGTTMNVRTKCGKVFPSALVYLCTGPSPTAPAYAVLCHPDRQPATTAGWIVTDAELSVSCASSKGTPSAQARDQGESLVLSCGDAAHLVGEDKTALLAEMQGEYAALRVLSALRRGRDRRVGLRAPFPQALTGTDNAPFLYCVSLGPYDGIIVFNSLVLHGVVLGKVAAFAKLVIEATKVWEMSRFKVWVWFWAFVAHPVVFWLHRFVLKRKR